MRKTVSQSKHFKMVEVSKGIYAAIDTEFGALGNAGVIDLGESLLVVDTMMTKQAAEDFRKVIGELFRKPIQYVVSTHWHGDHVRGNQVFDDATIIATKETYDKMKERIQLVVDQQKAGGAEFTAGLEKQYEEEMDNEKKEELRVFLQFVKEVNETLDQFQLRLPDQLITHTTHIRGTERTVTIHPMGSGHSLSDTIIYVEEEKIAFIGDLCFIGHFPVVQEGDYRSWIHILKDLEIYNFETIIPGHGDIGTIKDCQFVGSVLEHVIDKASKVDAEDEIEKLPFPDEYQGLKGKSSYYQCIKAIFTREKK